MTAEIIPFPVKHQVNSQVQDQVEEEVFPADWPYTVAGVPVVPPSDGFDYLALCKRFLDPEIYSDLLIAIMDKDGYDGSEPEIQKLVDNYYWYMNNKL